MTKAIVLFSGGLDSIVAAKVVQQQGIEVIGMTFETPFFTAAKARAAARQASVPLEVLDITEEHLVMLRAPRYGYGRNMNPCIDCHALMLKTAGGKMKELGADFLMTGEVLGQRPMSQTRQSLQTVARLSGYADYIVRPLSARLLPETLPEKEGKLDRSRLLDIQGRGRKRQMALVQSFGISEYSNPAGGCLLTDPIFSRRLKDLLTHQSDFQRRDFELLKSGRHVRITEHTKIIVGKNERDNTAILNFRREGDAILDAKNYPGPVVLIPSGADPADLETAAAICARYSDAPKGQEIIIECQADGKTIQIHAKSADPDEVAKLII
jgi:tRNA-uridine 2-sulfurtransferase